MDGGHVCDGNFRGQVSGEGKCPTFNKARRQER